MKIRIKDKVRFTASIIALLLFIAGIALLIYSLVK